MRADAEPHINNPELYPELSDRERRQAMVNLRRYFEIAVAIAEENAEGGAGLTESDSIPTMKERSIDILKI